MSNTIIEVISNETVKEKLTRIIEATEAISKKQPVLGFHHRFYVPGWIGLIQQIFVENKMDAFASQPFFKEKNYNEYAEWLITSTTEVAQTIKEECAGQPELQHEQMKAACTVMVQAAETWAACALEVATMCNRQINEHTLMSLYGIVYRNIIDNMSETGNEISQSHNDSSIGEDLKDGLYRIAGMILNAIILFGVIGIFGAIFG